MTKTFDYESALISALDALEQARFILDTVLEDAEFQASEFPSKLFYLVRAGHGIITKEATAVAEAVANGGAK